jgi:hypothetical protein
MLPSLISQGQLARLRSRDARVTSSSPSKPGPARGHQQHSQMTQIEIKFHRRVMGRAEHRPGLISNILSIHIIILIFYILTYPLRLHPYKGLIQVRTTHMT